MKSKTNRNDPCPCGSGKKYKNCHENKETKNTNKVPWILGIIFLIAIGFLVLKPNQNLKSSGGKPGQVWSEEHGHWHDAPSTPVTPTTPAQAKPAQPQEPASSNTATQVKSTRPPGPAPEGKVWSEEHGHWHNAPTTEQSENQ